MTDAANKLITRLNGKIILFVDDQRTTVGDYTRRLRSLGVTCETIDSLDQAVERINQSNPSPVGLVLVDLNMPSSRSTKLKKYFKIIHETPTSRNLGRALGLYLWYDTEIPYGYFSALTVLYGDGEGEFDGQDNYINFLIDKVTIMPSKLPDALVKLLEDWDKVKPPVTGNAV